MHKLFLFILCLFFTLPVFAAETYLIDPSHSSVLWHVNHFGFSNPSGKWMVGSGTLLLDETKPADSQVEVTIQVADIVTGIPKLDEHLKSKDFFDVATFPTAIFKSNKIDMIGKNKAKVHGILTVHGISKPITLAVTLNKIGVSPITGKKTVGFTATTQFKRSLLGINKYLPGLGDDVKIDIEAEANLK